MMMMMVVAHKHTHKNNRVLVLCAQSSTFHHQPLLQMCCDEFFTICLLAVHFSYLFLSFVCYLQVRTFGSMLCMLSNSIFAFISLKTFPILLQNLNLYGVSWICAGVCFYGILFSIFILEETKGKNLNECSKSKITPTNE